MKQLLTIAGVVVCYALEAQVSVYDGNMSTRYVGTTELNNALPVEGNRIEIGNPGNTAFTNDLNKEVTACTEIRLAHATHLKAPATGSNELRLSIVPDKLDIYSHSHTNLSQIHALEKFETGVELPQEIKARIAAYKLSDQDTSGLNPFMEWDVALKVTYTHLATGYTHFNYGFYYEDYTRFMPGYPTSNHLNWSWRMTAGTEEFRVRYAFPERNGTWKVEYELFVNDELYYSYCPFNVRVVDKHPGDGYVKVAENKRVLERDGDLFLPIGHNMQWPQYYQRPNGTWIYCEYDESGKPCESAAFVAFDQKLQAFADSDVDYFRFHLSPGSIDFEFEKMGNYFDRLNYAVEIDKIIEFAEAEDIYVDFNMKVHYNLMQGPVYFLFAWDGSDYTAPGFPESYGKQQYCYVEELNMNSPAEFFTNEEAKKFYKQKLRYLISRWGYSTHIAMFELISEINQVGDEVTIDYSFPEGVPVPDTAVWWNYSHTVMGNRPYESDFNHRANTYQWQKEMAEYIKHGLQHREHILTCNYAGFLNPDGDSTFAIPELDIVTLNWYAHGNLNLSGSMQSYVDSLHQTYDKPVLFSETGPMEEFTCSGKYSYTQELWKLAFTGVAGFNYWDAERAHFAPEWAEMKALKDWIMNDPVKKNILLGSWKAGHSHGTVRGTADTYWRKDLNYIYETTPGNTSSFQTAFGSLINLTENYYTNMQVDSSWCINWENKNPWLRDRIGFDSGLSLNNQIFKKNDLTALQDPLLVPWGYSNYESHLIWYDLPSFTPIFGNWVNVNSYTDPLSHPTLHVTEENVAIYGNSGILPFEGDFREIPDGMTVNNQNEGEASEVYAALENNNRLEIFRVSKSATGKRNTSSEGKESVYEVSITNVMGQKIYEGTVDLNAQSGIFTETFPTGMLIITLVNNNEKHTLRWLNL